MCFVTASALAAWRQASTTAKPLRASSVAVALPTPSVAPVMRQIGLSMVHLVRGCGLVAVLLRGHGGYSAAAVIPAGRDSIRAIIERVTDAGASAVSRLMRPGMQRARLRASARSASVAQSSGVIGGIGILAGSSPMSVIAAVR